MRLILFDIDGTLITAHGAGRLALTSAMRATYGTAGDVGGYDFRGKTDPRIVRDLAIGAGVPPSKVAARLPACFDRYVRDLDALLRNGHRVDCLPGVTALVQALSRRNDVVVGLLTGNIETGARVKLRPTGLGDLFRIGAFGSDDDDRRRLPAIARARAEQLVGQEFPFGRIVIIGDTPLDVDCAQACGAHAVAVATGDHSLAELSRCTPALLLPDFRDLDASLRALTEL
jgi:phosphoglycolate phosphatase-like HAD superfamily hydrolase